jgi:cytochrome c oxidase subunit 4
MTELTTDSSHAEHHASGGNGKYLAVFVVLCLLTGASFFTYSEYWPYRDSPAVGRAFMLAVSCTKALLVILFFMHLFWEANWKYVLTIPAAFMSLFLILMLVPDIGWRRNTGFAQYSEERLQHAAQPQRVSFSGDDARAAHGALEHMPAGDEDAAHHQVGETTGDSDSGSESPSGADTPAGSQSEEDHTP